MTRTGPATNESASSRQPSASPSATGTVQPFNLTRRFLVLSLLCILLTSAGSATLLSTFLTDNMLRRDAVVAQGFVNSIVRAEHAEPLFKGHDPGAEPGRFENLFKHIAAIPDMLRANVYASDRSIIWSSDPEIIGVEFRTNPELDKAFLGELVIEQGVIGEIRKAEQAFLESTGPRFIENYIPVQDRGASTVIGVVELYKSPSTLLAAIHRGQQLVWISAGLGAVVLYLALFWIIERASRIIGMQQRRLVASETLAVVGEMASAVAHGLRNPLASIRSSAELGLEERPPEELRELLTDIVGQSDRLEGWIGEFLSNARPMAGEIGRIALEEVIEECVEGFEFQLEKQGIVSNVTVDESLPPVIGSAASLRQVLNSLLANAVEAMPRGGELRVSAHCDRPEGLVRVCITDSGHGVPQEQVDKLFQPFSTTKGTGLGVGLYLAKRIMERHRGTLELTRPAEGGTRATIGIPVAE